MSNCNKLSAELAAERKEVVGCADHIKSVKVKDAERGIGKNEREKSEERGSMQSRATSLLSTLYGFLGSGLEKPLVRPLHIA